MSSPIDAVFPKLDHQGQRELLSSLFRAKQGETGLALARLHNPFAPGTKEQIKSYGWQQAQKKLCEPIYDALEHGHMEAALLLAQKLESQWLKVAPNQTFTWSGSFQSLMAQDRMDDALTFARAHPRWEALGAYEMHYGPQRYYSGDESSRKGPLNLLVDSGSMELMRTILQGVDGELFARCQVEGSAKSATDHAKSPHTNPDSYRKALLSLADDDRVSGKPAAEAVAAAICAHALRPAIDAAKDSTALKLATWEYEFASSPIEPVYQAWADLRVLDEPFKQFLRQQGYAKRILNEACSKHSVPMVERAISLFGARVCLDSFEDNSESEPSLCSKLAQAFKSESLIGLFAKLRAQEPELFDEQANQRGWFKSQNMRKKGDTLAILIFEGRTQEAQDLLELAPKLNHQSAKDAVKYLKEKSKGDKALSSFEAVLLRAEMRVAQQAQEKAPSAPAPRRASRL